MFSMTWRVTLTGLLAAQLAACGGKKDEGEKAPAGEARQAATAGAKKALAGEVKANAGEQAADQKQAPAVEQLTGPVAKVNGVTLDSDEFNRKYEKMTKAFTTRNKEIPDTLAKRYKESILKQLVERELLKQKIEAEKVEITDEEITAEFEKYKKMFRTDENFQRYLKSSQLSVEQIKDNVRYNQAVNKLLEKVADVKVTPEEAQAYYDKNKDRYAVKAHVRASHILLKVPKNADEAAVAEVKKKADGIYAEAAKAGADFAELAKKHSEGPTAPRGGDLSFFPKGRMVKEFEEKAFTMNVGDLSKPVKTQFGWHIIKVTDKKEARQRPFDEVKENIEKNLEARKSRQAKQTLLDSLREAAKVEVLVEGLSFNPTTKKGATPPVLTPIPKK